MTRPTNGDGLSSTASLAPVKRTTGAEPLAWYPWFWRDWRANLKVQRMTPLERGLYRELLDECWCEGSLPDDIGGLAEIARCEVADMEKAWVAIRVHFSQRPDGRWVNDKIVRVLMAQQEAHERQVLAGRRGGLAKGRLKGASRGAVAPLKQQSRAETATALTAGAAALEAAPPPPAPSVASNGNGKRPPVSPAVRAALDPASAVDQQYRDVAGGSRRIPPPTHGPAADPEAVPPTDAQRAELAAVREFLHPTPRHAQEGAA